VSRTYDQYCGVARALDILGERWTLLIVRDLLLGPRRFGDLLDGLPGIGTNMLSMRLKTLEAAGLIRRSKLPPPAGSTVYELTEHGRGLEEPLIALGRWGFTLLEERHRGEHYRFRWLLLGMKATFNPDAAHGLDDTYEFRIEDEIFWATVRDGQLDVGSGPARDPDAIITTDLDTFIGIGTGEVKPTTAFRRGKLTVEGDGEAALRAAALFSNPPDQVGPLDDVAHAPARSPRRKRTVAGAR
jgi:DNA-binding HxlR family transcriptional regulator/putative sterol carrier protein